MATSKIDLEQIEDRFLKPIIDRVPEQQVSKWVNAAIKHNLIKIKLEYLDNEEWYALFHRIIGDSPEEWEKSIARVVQASVLQGTDGSPPNDGILCDLVDIVRQLANRSAPGDTPAGMLTDRHYQFDCATRLLLTVLLNLQNDHHGEVQRALGGKLLEKWATTTTTVAENVAVDISGQQIKSHKEGEINSPAKKRARESSLSLVDGNEYEKQRIDDDHYQTTAASADSSSVVAELKSLVKTQGELLVIQGMKIESQDQRIIDLEKYNEDFPAAVNLELRNHAQRLGDHTQQLRNHDQELHDHAAADLIRGEQLRQPSDTLTNILYQQTLLANRDSGAFTGGNGGRGGRGRNHGRTNRHARGYRGGS